MRDPRRNTTRKYTKGENPYLDPLISDDETVYMINWERGRFPVSVPNHITDKKKYAEQKYRDLYE